MPSADTPDEGRQGKPLKVLLATGNWWPAPARLAAALIEHGCVVSALCPPGHPLSHVRDINGLYPYRCLTSLHSLAKVLRLTRPDIVVPCDDRCVSQLHELCRDHPDLGPLIERSLGDARGFELLESRSKLLNTARELGIRAADAFPVSSEEQAAECYARCGPTALLKMDGTNGGQGVRLVRSEREAAAAYRRLKSEAGLAVALKRATINQDPQAVWSWRRRAKAAITMQRFVLGTPANIMVACWKGQILGEVSVRADSCQGPTGAALVVQVIDNPGFSRAAALLAARLGMSGFFGLDFILEHGTGSEYLIEMNPRATQLGHLKLPRGDLAGALCGALVGRKRSTEDHLTVGDRIAFFPQAWHWGAGDAFHGRVHHDVPWEQKRLVVALMQVPWPERQWRARLYHQFRRRAPMQALEIRADSSAASSCERSGAHSRPVT